METLRALRTGKLHTIRSIAVAAGVTPKTIVDIEAGRVAPQFGTIRKIATALGVTPGAITEFAEAIDQAGKSLAA